MVLRDHRNLHVGDRDRLVSIIRHNEKNRQKTVLCKVGRKYLRLLGRVVRIGRNRNLRITMKIVRRIVDRRLSFRLYKVLGGERPGNTCGTQQHSDEKPALRPRTKGLHLAIIEAGYSKRGTLGLE